MTGPDRYTRSPCTPGIMVPAVEIFQRFLPAHLVRSVRDGRVSADGPTRIETCAAVLLFDISGFTALCERYTRRGPAGIEALTDLLNAYFGTLVETILAHGGDIVSFGGDAMIAVWEGTDATDSSLRASLCGLALQRRMVQVASVETEKLALKVAIDQGELAYVYGGGVLGRWESVVTGQALQWICDPALHLVPQAVTLSGRVIAALGDRVELGPQDETGAHLLGVRALVDPWPTQEQVVPPAREAAVKSFLQRSIRVRLEAGHGDWLAELREISAVFISLAELDHRDVARTHRLLVAIQRALYRYEGSLYQFFVDNKGATVIAAFGLPLISHENDPERAVFAALAVRDAVRAEGVPCRIGVATGRVFSGIIGTPQRRLYALIGDAMNLAARLMQQADDDVLCDAVTAEGARARLHFEALPAVPIRGRSEPVGVFRPLQVREETPGGPDARTVGRVAERQALRERLDALVATSTPSVVLLEGEAGIGKSTLVHDLLTSAVEEPVHILLGAADPIERFTPWFAWRAIVRDLAGHLVGLPHDQVEQALVTAGVAPEDTDFAPLLNPLLGLDLPDNPVTAQMSGDARGETTHRLVVQLIQSKCRALPVVLVLEDAHWFDSASWKLAVAVAREVRPLMMLVAARPAEQGGREDRELLVEGPAGLALSLGGLSPSETVALAARSLGVEALPEGLIRLLQERSDGNPFYAVELLRELLDAGTIQVADGACSVVDPDLLQDTLPRTLQGVITARIDRVAPSLQLTLKVASVIGREFEQPTLDGIFPVSDARRELHAYLHELSVLDFTPIRQTEPVASYYFKHAITRDVAYNLMLFAQRRSLHRKLAEWLESRHADDVQWLPLLTHHWTLADDKVKAVSYGSRSAVQALAAYANPEALAFLDEVETLESQGGLVPTDTELERREEIRAEALMRLGHYGDAIGHYENALRLLGSPIPRRGGGIATQLIGEILSHVWSRLRKRTNPRLTAGRERVRRSAGIRNELVKLYFFGQHIGQGLYSMIRQLNEANMAGPSPELASALASAGAFFSVLGMPGLARYYNNRAEELLGTTEHIATKGYVRHVLCFQYMFAADWQGAEHSLRTSNEHYARIGASHTEAALHPQVNLAIVFGYCGRLADAATLYRRVLALAEGSANLVSQIQGHAFLADILLRQGDPDLATEHADQAVLLIGDSEFPAEKLVALSVLARGHQVLGAQESAHQAATALGPMLKYAPGLPYTLVLGLSHAADYHLAARDGGDPGAEPALKRTLKAMTGFAKVFRFGVPPRLRIAAECARATGRSQEASRLYQACVDDAIAIGMPYEQGLALVAASQVTADPEQKSRAAAEGARLLADLGVRPATAVPPG